MTAKIKQGPRLQFREDDSMLVRLCEDPSERESCRQRVRAQYAPLVPERHVHRILKNYPKMSAVDRDAEDHEQPGQPGAKRTRYQLLILPVARF